MEFKTPLALVLVFLVPLLLWLAQRKRDPQAFRFSSTEILKQAVSWKTRLAFLPFALRLLAIALICVALAGPRKVLEESPASTEGVDIVLVLDVSGSMAAEDFTLEGKRFNRLEIIKKVVAEFIGGRTQDRLGLVAFGGRAYTVCPLTTDQEWLLSNLERIRLGLVEDGTAIGSGVASALSRFKDSRAKSKVVILLTDGSNNAGRIDPMSAAKSAAAMGVKVYTIGAGTRGMAPYPVRDMFGRSFYQNVPVEIDEGLLKKMAETTGASYFRATDTESLRKVYQEIDRLEKTVIEHSGYKEYEEMFRYFVMAALIVLALELILSNTLLMKIP